MKQNARTVYRVRAVWMDRMWVAESPDLAALLVHAHRFDEVGPVARNTLARLTGEHGSTIEVALQPISLSDPELQWNVERALVSQEHAKSLAEEAAERTLDAVDKLCIAGMDYVDAQRILGLSENSEYERRHGGYGVHCLDIDPWLRKDDDSEPVDPWHRWGFSSDDPSFPARLLKALGDEVGGPLELAVLDDAPLPTEEFAWDGIADDIVPLVAEVLVHCDAACDAVFDDEARTAARRLLAHTARRAPGLFRRRAKAQGAAGAICWIIGSANQLFDTAVKPRHKDLSAALGISNSSGRARTFMVEGGFSDDRWYGRVLLWSPRYLVSAHRRRIIELRDQYSATGEHA